MYLQCTEMRTVDIHSVENLFTVYSIQATNGKMLEKRINERVIPLIKLEINCIKTRKWDRKKELTTSELRFIY